MGLWLLAMLVIFTLAGKEWLPIQSASFALVFLLWPTAAVVVKRLHDRNKAGWWALLAVLAWMLMAGNWQMLTPIWQWGLGDLSLRLFCHDVYRLRCFSWDGR